MFEPLVDDDLSLLCCGEPLGIENLRGATEVAPYPKEAIAGRINRLTFRRLGRVEDAVGPAIFLATSDSDWVTGSVIYADGGYTTAAETDPEYRAKEVPYRGP